MDILWVIDNSGSMIEEQKELQENFNSFITSFVGNGYDFRIAVITTDAWITGDFADMPTAISNLRPGGYTNFDDFNASGAISSECDGVEGVAPFGPDPTEFVQSSPLLSSAFLDGNVNYGEVSPAAVGSTTGYPIISSLDDDIANGGTIDFSLTSAGDGDANSSDDIESIFGQSVLQGVCGSGAESGIRSVLTALDNPANAGFPREDAHFAVIVVSDEEDNIDFVNRDTNPAFSVANVDSAIKAKLLGSSTYSFHTIGILDGDTTCLDASSDVYQASFTTKYEDLSDLSGGEKISLCSDFSVGLQEIAQTIIETTVEFPLVDTPENPDGAGFVVSVKPPGGSDFAVVPKDDTNGWSYNAERNSIVFNGNQIPAQGAEINIVFDPDSL